MVSDDAIMSDRVQGASVLQHSFEWDRRKADANLRKHGVAFAEAASVFANALAIVFDDPDHSETEDREILIGHSTRGRVLVVSFTLRKNAIRVISARTASKLEQRTYERQLSKGSPDE